MKKDNANAFDLSWEEIEKYMDNDPYQEFFKQIPLSIYKMAMNEKDRPKVIEAIMKVLRENDPKNATEEYAGKIADSMQKVAQKVLKERLKK